MSYTLNYGKDGNTTLTVPDGQSGTVANLTFPGRNFSGYGSPVDQNFMSLVENFTSANVQGPQYAIQGQLWYDVTDANVTLKYDGLKVNTSNTNAANWTNFVTFDKSANLSAQNPKNISGVGTLTANVGTITTVNATTANVQAIALNGGNITNANVVTANTISTGNIGITGNISASGITTNTLTVSSTFAFGPGTGATPHQIRYSAGDANITIIGDLRVTGGIQVDGSSSNASVTNLNVNSPFIQTGVTSPTPAATTTPDSGLLMNYYANTGSSTISKTAYMGWLGKGSGANAGSALSANLFIVAKEANLNTVSGNIIDVVSWGDFKAGRLTAVTSITSPLFSGPLANASTTTTNVTVNTSNIVISASGNSVMTATDTYVNIISSSSAGANSGALRVTGNASISGNLYVGNIFGTLVTTAPATMPSASISGTATITTGIIATINSVTINNSGTVTTNQLLVNTSAQVQSFVSNTSIACATLTSNSGITVTGNSAVSTTNFTTGANTTAGYITGAWTLTAGSTLEATYSADLAERHHADATYPTGTVMTVGGTNEITAANEDSKVLGVISEQWAYLMNGGAGPQETHPAVAYVGRVPVRVVGPVNKHDQVSPFKDGVATASRSNSFGWALETNLDSGEKLVLCIVK
jgi:hypothetical protein